MAGYQHDLPIVVFACVEELYRTGQQEKVYPRMISLFTNPPLPPL
jgi:hypothetical protein